jgi:tetratricopeptide (TPR) repeat protein
MICYAKHLLKVAGASVFGILLFSTVAFSESVPDCYSGSFGQRLKACSDVIENGDSNPEDLFGAYIMRGRIHALNGRFPDSISDYDAAVRINPDSSLALNNRAWTHFKWNRSTQGMNDVERALGIEPLGHYIWDTRAHLRQVLGDFDGAYADYERSAGIGGAEAVTLYQCGLRERGLYNGPIDGRYSADVRTALKTCAYSETCDPLPKNELAEDCLSATS